MNSHTNRLINETSPYLLQHAHNPVDWFPWGEEALQKAKTENKPILVSIGYAACHWCHVMEKESFEDEATAGVMNEHFVNIKIDREERPDLDHIYMDAVQAMTGSGGWPLNVFLTPAGKPFYGGTYYPPKRAFNRASWQEVLEGVRQAFNERRHEIDAQAENLTAHLEQSNSFGLQKPADSGQVFTKEKLDTIFDNIMKQADLEWGGFGKAPKFPQTFTIQYLLRYAYIKGLERGSPKPPPEEGAFKSSVFFKQAETAVLSLDKMIQGGLYDQAGGGFARYSTDAEWLAPHFEKMLYDNALLLIVLSEAYLVSGNERYKEVIGETMDFIQRELLHPQKGFYSALDADSEGEEGKFYVWQKMEVDDILGEDAAIFSAYYDITNQGNWEGTNILRVKKPLASFAAENGIDINPLKELLDRGRKKLLEKRSHRVRPLLDDKILLGWNALMNSAASKAFEATGNESYRQLAVDNMRFLLEKFRNKNGGFYHTWKNDQAKYPGFLDDYAYLVQSLINLYEITTDTQWLLEARDISNYVIQYFSEEATGFFFYTAEGQQDIIVRKKEVYDGATPSGNAVMAGNLYRLSIFFDSAEWRERSFNMVASLGPATVRYPTSFGAWNTLLMEMITGTHEIAIVGKNAQELHAALVREFIPNRVLMASVKEDNTFTLLREKPYSDPASIFLCKNFSCLRPVYTISELMSLINNSRPDI